MLIVENRTLQMPVMPGDALAKGAAKQAVDILAAALPMVPFVPGEIMPTEPELAASLRVCRNTIR
ncbi:GntR family transcriptional regulator [Devosia psychrophila]|uniref:Regulatory protein, gntR family n=1 Tax=Devosia psychrophila TaxID=728005 RepID=A0A0F5PVB7_9HYPH|nr:GntR family transcriptional regulator [Devosia psychrophila]KKC32356.1 hypothetical protein WH91_14460 [Devosia psychrophila]SFD28336.1 regulatory protein, gntR family [Devosia psychrophila]